MGYQGFPANLDPLQDKDGHGTHGASVLLKTAPNATLLVVRVANDKRQIYTRYQRLFCGRKGDYSVVEISNSGGILGFREV